MCSSRNHRYDNEGEVRSKVDLDMGFHTAQPIEVVILLGGRKAFGESVEEFLRYWDINIAGNSYLLSVM